MWCKGYMIGPRELNDRQKLSSVSVRSPKDLSDRIKTTRIKLSFYKNHKNLLFIFIYLQFFCRKFFRPVTNTEISMHDTLYQCSHDRETPTYQAMIHRINGVITDKH